MATDYLLQEHGASKLVLEDGTGDLILESSTAATNTAGPLVGSNVLNKALVGGGLVA